MTQEEIKWKFKENSIKIGKNKVLVYQFLESHKDAENNVSYSKNTISQMLQITEDTVNQSIRALVNDGLLERFQRGHYSSKGKKGAATIYKVKEPEELNITYNQAQELLNNTNKEEIITYINSFQNTSPRNKEMFINWVNRMIDSGYIPDLTLPMFRLMLNDFGNLIKSARWSEEQIYERLKICYVHPYKTFVFRTDKMETEDTLTRVRLD